ncbi:uncharacterized protein LOC115163323 [Salmo trutta]|uniref:uncharacterized protein LOC115163323 n=1 Tax=Salmo trutta TaxID=8032 RepID=UPI0011313FFD|nr:uncharacterized protein LOC115163323 [Salmo trutta]
MARKCYFDNRKHCLHDFTVAALISGCSVVLTDALRNIVYNSFHHVKRNHLQHLLDCTRPDEQPSEESQAPPEQDNIQPDSLLANSSITDQQLHPSDSDDGQRVIDQHGAVTVQQNLITHATAFVINTRAKHHLSQKGVNDIVAGVQQYQSSLLDNLRKQMEAVLKKHSGSTSGQLEKDAMDIFDNFIDPFAGVATFRQDSVIKKLFGCRGNSNCWNHMQDEMWRIKRHFHQRQIILLCTISQKSRAVLITPNDFVYG